MDIKEQQIPLWRQLQATASVLMDIRSGISGTAAMAGVVAELKPGVQSLVFHVLRSLGRAEALRQLLASRAPRPPADALLCTALALAWRDDEAPYEVFTLVNQAVEAAKRSPVTQAQASFINACLRRFLRERDHLVALTDKNPVAVWNHPKWWIDRVQKDWPNDWQEILRANNQHAPMTLRVNAQKSNVQSYLQALKDLGFEGVAAGEWGVTLTQAKPVQVLPGFLAGVVSVQDGAAQLAAPLLLKGLNTNGPARVLDACAAPGGKTAHLLEMADCQVTALDVDADRCVRIHETLGRLGLTAKVLVADAAKPSAWWDGQVFDAILLDAPCSASGIVRRHPDVRWLRRESDIGQLAIIQAQLLKSLWSVLKPGGRLLYCTCSVFRAEGENQVKAFIASNPGAALLPSPGHLLPTNGLDSATATDNLIGDHDGFYYALLEKHKA
jgi:16S rRNA (cytosine967-C5)-methyltransferase